ncbi:MAG: S-layer homology domain-containing protein [Candidatus Cellulosilyticum pullistercoris]|uniref:S-layer homology domain-containing protein n=1 Tax=Candidatus Cellulosilyticum pullistercoris TaxID=2838521 RepID=A0A9E2KDD0_9FIRM|nr:S-layer homology domain-containing protein [Candidatus Cellulosilyticum pullistercoris]
MYRKFLCFIFSILLICNITSAATLPDISADGAILIETTTNTILYSKNLNETFYPASTTKILTSLAIAEDLPLNQIITKSQDALNNVPSDSSQIGLNVGDSYTVLDGLHAVLMASDNFVCYDLAKADSGSIQNFATKMNTLAFSFGATRTNFVNPHGYHDPLHYTTPFSLSQIALHAFSNPVVEKIAGTQSYNFKVANTGKIIPITHTAALLDPNSTYYNEHVVAAKTGYHTPAGRTLVAKARYDNIELIAVVMRTDAPLQFEDINKLFKYGSENFTLGTDQSMQPYIINNTYSPWAKPYVERALDEGWITRTTHNYTTPITMRTFLSLLRDATDYTVNSFLDDKIQYNGSSIYRENLPTTRGEIAQIIYEYLSNLDLALIPSEVIISDIDSVSPKMQEAIEFCVKSGLLNTRNGNAFSPDMPVTYEEAICLISKITDISNNYNSYHL